MQEKIKTIDSLDELQTLYSSVFGKNGTMTARLRDMKNLDTAARAELNKENVALRELFRIRQTELEQAALMSRLAGERMDATLDAAPENRGTIHPLTQALAEVSLILESFGYTMHTGPEVEDDWHNFTVANTPAASSRA